MLMMGQSYTCGVESEQSQKEHVRAIRIHGNYMVSQRVVPK